MKALVSNLVLYLEALEARSFTSFKFEASPLTQSPWHPRSYELLLVLIFIIIFSCHVPALPSVTNHDLVTIRFCRANVVKSTRLYPYIQGDQVGSQGAQQDPPRNTSFNFSRQILLATWRGLGSFTWRMWPRAPSQIFSLLYLLPPDLLDYFSIRPPDWLCILQILFQETT